MPWLYAVAVAFALAGLYEGFVVAPVDATQGNAYRIIFIHVPAAWMSMVLYLAMAFWAAIGWAFHARMASIAGARAGAHGCRLHLFGTLDGRLLGQTHLGRLVGVGCAPDLGTDFVVFVPGFYGPGRSDDTGAAPTGRGLLAIVGAVNVPVIISRCRWWNTLHQGATISMTAAPKMAHTMLAAMLLMTIACWAYAFAVVFVRARAVVIEREAATDWVRALPNISEEVHP